MSTDESTTAPHAATRAGLQANGGPEKTARLAGRLCGECGYDLTGIAAGLEFGCCPECGSRFVTSYPFEPEPWPSAWRLGIWMCGPTLILAALCVTLAQFAVGQLVLLLILPIVGVAWPMLGLVLPGIIAHRVATRTVSVSERIGVMALLVSVAAIINGAVSVGAFVALLLSSH